MLRKAFECRLCHSEFTTNSDLWFHRQTVHGAGAASAARNSGPAKTDGLSDRVSAEEGGGGGGGDDGDIEKDDLDDQE